MKKEIKVLLFGIGAIGSAIAKELLRREGYRIIGAVDIDPNKVDKDLGEVIGIERKLGILVTNDLDKALGKEKADIAIHTTTSYLRDTFDQIVSLIRRKLNVISTCEELSYPYLPNPELATKIDNEAKKNGVTVLGSGINPGFLMDTLVLILTTPCLQIERIDVTRVIDASKRRIPFQKKIGVGLLPSEFKRYIEERKITGHVGLKESLALIAESLGWKLTKITEDYIGPVVTEKSVESQLGLIEKGRVIGLKQEVKGLIDDQEKIKLRFEAYLGADEVDEIIIRGDPPIHQRIVPCVHGDKGTVAVIINLIPRVLEAKPGLVTMNEIKLPHFYSF